MNSSYENRNPRRTNRVSRIGLEASTLPGEASGRRMGLESNENLGRLKAKLARALGRRPTYEELALALAACESTRRELLERFQKAEVAGRYRSPFILLAELIEPIDDSGMDAN